MRQLYIKLYLAMVVAVLISQAVAVVTLQFVWGEALHKPGGPGPAIHALTQQVPELSDERLSDAVRELGDALNVELVVWSVDGTVLSHTGDEPTIDYPGEAKPGNPGRTAGPEYPPFRGRRMMMPGISFLPATDGRLVGVKVDRLGRPFGRMLPIMIVLFIVMAVACFPIARMITRRLERLEAGVENWGSGALGTRVAVEGRDEIAKVADKFNTAATRVEALLTQQRRMLASASHEFRSPLTRVRMAVELLRGHAGLDDHRDRVFDGAERDIAELDELIGDLLLAARADNLDNPPPSEPVDLLAELGQEAKRLGLPAAGEHVFVLGDRRMLRRLCRNLLDNAQKHGGKDDIGATVKREQDRAVIEVCDRGPGIPAEEKERIFEPFYRPTEHSEARDGGVGLGLALVKQIAGFHGGTVRCVDRVGGGTRFIVEIPACSD